MSDDYRIVVPSRRRTAGLSPLLLGLKRITFCVDEKEEAVYRAALPSSIEVMTHPSVEGISAISQFILDNRPEKCVVICDDDLKRVLPMCGNRRKAITDPVRVQQIIENGVYGILDLGLGLFAHFRNPNPAFFQSHDPFHLVAPCAGLVGIADRELRYDPQLVNGEDIDLTLQSLLRNRVVLQDSRFYFDFGSMGSGNGGLQGVRTDENVLRSMDIVSKRWGQYVELYEKSMAGKTSGGASLSTSMSIRVKRKHAL